MVIEFLILLSPLIVPLIIVVVLLVLRFTGHGPHYDKGHTQANYGDTETMFDSVPGERF